MSIAVSSLPAEMVTIYNLRATGDVGEIAPEKRQFERTDSAN